MIIMMILVRILLIKKHAYLEHYNTRNRDNTNTHHGHSKSNLNNANDDNSDNNTYNNDIKKNTT